jgi:LysR family hydrogen peroxide-inducible transcriptional activator
LFEEPFFAALPPGHPLTAQSVISQSDLCRERILVMGEGHCLRDQARLVCETASRIGDDIQATSLETLRGLVAAGQGATLLPALARRESENDICVRPIAPASSRVIRLLVRRADPRRDEGALLSQSLRDALPRRLIE